jgi:hypothetical protein
VRSTRYLLPPAASTASGAARSELKLINAKAIWDTSNRSRSAPRQLFWMDSGVCYCAEASKPARIQFLSEHSCPRLGPGNLLYGNGLVIVCVFRVPCSSRRRVSKRERGCSHGSFSSWRSPMSNSVGHGDGIVVWKPEPVSLVAAKQPPHQPHQSVTRCWLADPASKPLGESIGSAGHQEVRRGRWDGSLKPPWAAGRQIGPPTISPNQ